MGIFLVDLIYRIKVSKKDCIYFLKTPSLVQTILTCYLYPSCLHMLQLFLNPNTIVAVYMTPITSIPFPHSRTIHFPHSRTIHFPHSRTIHFPHNLVHLSHPVRPSRSATVRPTYSLGLDHPISVQPSYTPHTLQKPRDSILPMALTARLGRTPWRSASSSGMKTRQTSGSG